MMRPEDIGALIAIEKGVKPAMVRKSNVKRK